LVFFVVDFADRQAGAHFNAGALGRREQNFVQSQARQCAKGRHLLIAEQELVLDNQLTAGIEDIHPVIGEPARQELRKDSECLVNAERVRRLAEADARHIEGRTAFDENDLDAALRERRRGGQAADATADHEHTSDIVHGRCSVTHV
jgi:hypothetical protein